MTSNEIKTNEKIEEVLKKVESHRFSNIIVEELFETFEYEEV